MTRRPRPSAPGEPASRSRRNSLVPHLKNRFKPIWWHLRTFSGLRMVARDGRMTVSYGELIQWFDGKEWTQLKLVADTNALVKRVPAGFKK